MKWPSEGTASRSFLGRKFRQNKVDVGNAGDPAFLFCRRVKKFSLSLSVFSLSLSQVGWMILGDVPGGTAFCGVGVRGKQRMENVL